MMAVISFGIGLALGFVAGLVVMAQAIGIFGGDE